MSFLTPPKAAKPLEAPPAPSRTDAELAAAAAEQRKRLYGEAPGRRSTLGGGLDAMGLIPTSTSRLLGLA